MTRILVGLFLLILPWRLADMEDSSSRQLIEQRLRSLSSAGHVTPMDCGTTTMYRGDDKVSACAQEAFENRKPFHVLYFPQAPNLYALYGVAGDADGNVFEVLYRQIGLLNLGLNKNEQAFDDNHIRVTTCIKPITLTRTKEGMLACVIPINEKESALAAQQKPIDTTVCAIGDNPSAFNNRLVRIRGHVSGGFEVSAIDGDGCLDSLWFSYGDGAASPGVVAYVSGYAQPGARDSEGKRILPVPVQLVRDSKFRRFDRLLGVAEAAYLKEMNSGSDELIVRSVTATFVGRIDAVPEDVHDFHVKGPQRHKPDYLGFGHMGQFDAEFVLQSVEDDAVADAPRRIQ